VSVNLSTVYCRCKKPQNSNVNGLINQQIECMGVTAKERMASGFNYQPRGEMGISTKEK
jgi:hypothetical protein